MNRARVLIVGLLVLAIGVAAWTVLFEKPSTLGKIEADTVLKNTDDGERMRGAFTLAISWQPAFCEGARNRPECRSQTSSRIDATQFSLHGLWPEPASAVYCDVPNQISRNDKNGRWRDLPTVELTDRVWDDLRVAMPGTQSMLHRHEWFKHGSCSNVSPNAYFSASLKLLRMINASAVGDLLENNIGDGLRANDIRDVFEEAFGRGAGKRVTVECAREGGRTMIGELRISLKGEIGSAPDLEALILAAPERSRGCPYGEVDRAGT